MKPALLVIDLQKAWCDRDATRRQLCAAAAEYVNAAAALFHRKKMPVVAIYHGKPGEGPHPGDPAYEFIDAVEIGVPDMRIDKKSGNAFWETELEKRLKDSGVDTVILCGYCAEYCVLATARGAGERGFLPVILRGGIASGRPDHIEFIERIEECISYGMLEMIFS